MAPLSTLAGTISVVSMTSTATPSFGISGDGVGTANAYNNPLWTGRCDTQAACFGSEYIPYSSLNGAVNCQFKWKLKYNQSSPTDIPSGSYVAVVQCRGKGQVEANGVVNPWSYASLTSNAVGQTTNIVSLQTSGAIAGHGQGEALPPAQYQNIGGNYANWGAVLTVQFPVNFVKQTNGTYIGYATCNDLAQQCGLTASCTNGMTENDVSTAAYSSSIEYRLISAGGTTVAPPF
jgi:hypothetical protein